MGITGEPVDDDMGRQKGEKITHSIDIGFPAETLIGSGLIETVKRRVPNDIEQVDFDSLHVRLTQSPGCGKHIALLLPGKTKNDVNADLQPPVSRAIHGLAKGLDVVAPVDTIQCPIVDRLETVLNGKIFYPAIEFGEKIEDRFIHAVGPCANRETHNVRHGQRLLVEVSQPFKRSIGVGERLKIGDESLGPIPTPEKGLP
jgi:hypothetical protein